MSAENEEDYDELPSISVNSLTRDLSVFAMPSAEVLASQRAREQQCERELRALRECEREDTDAVASKTGVVRMTHSDSSGSEGEAVLSTAVGALRVHPSAPPAGPTRPSALVLLEAVRDHLHRPAAAEPGADSGVNFLDDYLRVLRAGDPRALDVVTSDILSSIISMVSCDDNEWSDEEVVCVGAWLCAVCVAGVGGSAGVGVGGRGGAARALHTLLDEVASSEQVGTLGSLLARSWTDSAVLVEASDVTRGGAGPGSAALADTLVRTALADILRPHVHEGDRRPVSVCETAALVASEWRRLNEHTRFTTVLLLGRMLAAHAEASGDACAAVLAALAAQPTHTHTLHKHTPEHLKVLVGASKLQLLFCAKK